MKDNTVLNNVKQFAEITPSLCATCEEVRQWTVLPLLQALGYDPYSRDITPVRIDTIPSIISTGAPVVASLVDESNSVKLPIIACLAYAEDAPRMCICCVRGVDNREYAAVASVAHKWCSITHGNVKIIIVTDGLKYMFYTCDTECVPYYEIGTLREIVSDETALDALCMYSKGSIATLDPIKDTLGAVVDKTCNEIVAELTAGNIPACLVEYAVDKVAHPKSARGCVTEYLSAMLAEKLKQLRPVEDRSAQRKKKSDTEGAEVATAEKEKKTMSNIKLRHDYVFNDYSDGDWTFHKMDHAVIFGVSRIEVDTGKKLLIAVIKEMLMRGIVNSTQLIQDNRFAGTYRISRSSEGIREPYYIDGYDLYISTAYSFNGFVKFIEKLLDNAGLPYDSVKISFKQ